MLHIGVSPRGSTNCFFMIFTDQLGFPLHERAAWAIAEDLRGRVIRGRAECDGDPGQTDHEWTITGRGARPPLGVSSQTECWYSVLPEVLQLAITLP